MVESKLWVWLVMFGGVMGIYALFLRINLAIKATVVYMFASCFLSAAPYIAFTSYVVLIACVYFYIVCLQVEDWTPVRNVLLASVALNLLLLFMQAIGKDALCNFGIKDRTCFGVVGNVMQLKSAIIISVAFLIAFIKDKGLLEWVIFTAIITAIWYLFTHPGIKYFGYARGGVWLETIRLANMRPWFGWGIGTYKSIFPALGKGAFIGEGAWMQAHNDWLQILFEAGRIGFVLVMAIFVRLFSGLKKINPFALTGLILMAIDMTVHFPTRQTQCVLIVIAFIAFCNQQINQHKEGMCPSI